MIKKLKPCPFCGGDALLMNGRGELHRPTWSVRCPKCRMDFGYDDYSGGMFKTQNAAIQAWNRRA